MSKPEPETRELSVGNRGDGSRELQRDDLGNSTKIIRLH